jgi:hypothetical protein
MMGSFSSGPSIFAVFIVAALLCSSCKPKKVTTDSDIQTTGCPSSGAGQELRRTRAMPDFVKVSMPILKKIVSKTNSFNQGGSGTASSIGYARKITTMLRNMVQSNVHPLAFFATIGDYETYQTSLGGFPWAEIGKRKWGSDIYRAGYCGSDTCTGVFQVLVYGDWFSWAQDLKGQGVGIWGLKGGPDWTSTLWWWTNDRDKNCTFLASGANPCTVSGVRWSVSQHVRNGRRAYGQQKQCGVEWDSMYWSYMSALKNSSDAYTRTLADVSAFAKEIGL